MKKGRMIGRHYIYTENKINYGCSAIFIIDSDRWNSQSIELLLEEIIPEKDYRLPATVLKEKRKKKVNALLNRRKTIMYYAYGPFSKERVLMLNLTVYPNTYFREWDYDFGDDSVVLGFTSKVTEIPPRSDYLDIIDDNYLEKIDFFLNLMENVFNFFKCDYGWSDLFDTIYESKDDPMKSIYSVNYFGRKQPNQIPNELVRKEMPWGGIIYQYPDNPYDR